MASVQTAELGRLNAQIVGYLLAQKSPPRDLVARRHQLRASLEAAAYQDQAAGGAYRRRSGQRA